MPHQTVGLPLCFSLLLTGTHNQVLESFLDDDVQYTWVEHFKTADPFEPDVCPVRSLPLCESTRVRVSNL